MARIKSANEIIQSILEFYRIAQPNLNTAVGSLSRDLLIDGPATELAKLYDELAIVSTKQSFKLSIGQDIDNLLANYNEFRKKGNKSQVLALLTFDNLDSDLAVIKGAKLFSKTGLTYLALNTITLSPVLIGTYQATAAKFRADLDFLGITDQYAVSILIEASVSGKQGDISKYTLTSSDIIGINHVTNVFPGSGGLDPETDTAVKNRFFSILSGASNGTALAYKTFALQDQDVLDAEVIEPGDSLMIRDGTQIFIAEDGTKTIISEGTGGKTDVIIFGSRLAESSDNYIYRDASNTGDPTNSNNDFILGQNLTSKTFAKKKLESFQTGIIPSQPINNIISIEGSSSGPNFKVKDVDEFGRMTGNYELISDSGFYGGSPFGLDKIHWISDRISLYPEDKTKDIFNGQETLLYSDIIEIKKCEQNIAILNENGKIDPKNRSIIQLSHFPCSSVTRVFNITTGERYIVTNQNLDGSGNINLTGRISITGKTLPSINDILQVDYIWIFQFDPNFDFDNKLTSRQMRQVGDSLDWGYSNFIRREQSILSSSGNFLQCVVLHPISSVVSVNIFDNFSGKISLQSGRLAIVVDKEIKNIESVTLSNGLEIWNVQNNNGTFKAFTIFLPTNTIAKLNDNVTVVYNSINVFTENSNFKDNIITIPLQIDLIAKIVECNYIANINILLSPVILSNFPIVKDIDAFKVLGIKTGFQPTSNIYNDDKIIQNLRFAPTNLSLTLAGNISPGTFTISGKGLISIFDIVFTISSNGLKQNLSSAIKKALKINSNTTIPSSYQIGYVSKFEKVETFSPTSDEIVNTIANFNLEGYEILNNDLNKRYSIANSSLKTTEIILPSTNNNISNNLVIGDKARITFYLINNEQNENIFFSKAGTLITQQKYLTVDIVTISSGFIDQDSQNSTLSISSLNQPTSKSRYRTNYDYIAPKENERITISFNYDKLIGDLTLSESKNRFINGDVLFKTAITILLDVTLNIIVSAEFTKTDSNLVKQNVQDVIFNFIKFKRDIIDASDLINIAYSVSGVDRIRIMHFNKANIVGTKLSITPQKNEYFYPNEIVVNIESR